MDSAHLRLEAVRVDGRLEEHSTELEAIPAQRQSMGLILDRRVASLRGAAGESAALLGFAVLPWCDVTVWGVALPSGQGCGLATGECRIGAGWSRSPASAWLRIELEHIDSVLAYVERMPVERSLVGKAWRWRWSSAAWHCGFGGKPIALAPEWSGPLRRDLWRERLAGAFVGRSDRSEPIDLSVRGLTHPPPNLVGSAIDRLSQRSIGPRVDEPIPQSAIHSPGMPSSGVGSAEEMEPSQGELAVA